jgi:hypothetical protein
LIPGVIPREGIPKVLYHVCLIVPGKAEVKIIIEPEIPDHPKTASE